MQYAWHAEQHSISSNLVLNSNTASKQAALAFKSNLWQQCHLEEGQTRASLLY